MIIASRGFFIGTCGGISISRGVVDHLGTSGARRNIMTGLLEPRRAAVTGALPSFMARVFVSSGQVSSSGSGDGGFRDRFARGSRVGCGTYE